jgi:hypothetical protein
MYQDTFLFFIVFGRVCARRLETKTYIQKQNQTSNKQNIEYVKYMYMYQDIFYKQIKLIERRLFDK